MSVFPNDVVEQHIRENHPGCPEFAVSYFSKEVASRNWRNATLGKAVGIIMHTFLRHQMTDYDTLLLLGIDREEARKRVLPRITAMIDSWSKRRKRTAEFGVFDALSERKMTRQQESPRDDATKSVGSNGRLEEDRRIGMTFNVERGWHKRFKMTAASRGMDMHQLLIESFAAWEREQA